MGRGIYSFLKALERAGEEKERQGRGLKSGILTTPGHHLLY